MYLNLDSISKSTISLWCRDIRLSKKAQYKISKNGKNKLMAGLLPYSESKRNERIERIKKNKKDGADMIGSFSERDMFMAGLGLYWGEGYKDSNGELGFTNSNPDMIIFYIKWLSLFGVRKDDLIFRLTINKFFEKYKKEIENFWVQLLLVSEDQFSKTTIIQSILQKASITNVEKYKGILRVKVRKGSVLKNKILGAIEYITKEGS